MTASRFKYTLAACLLVAAPASAQAPLMWKFAKGQVYEVERTATQTLAVELKGKQFKQQQRSTWQVRLEVKEQQGDNFIVLATLTKVEHESSGAADTEKIDPKLHEKMQGSVFTLETMRTGRLAKLEGYEDFLERLAEKGAARLKALRVTFPEAAVKEALADLFGPLPDKEFAWQREYVEPIPHFGALRSTAHYKYAGTKKGRDMIQYTIETKYEAPPKDDKSLFHIVKGSIDSDKVQGTINFDKAAGHLLEHERSMRLRGSLTIEAMERRESLEFTSTNDVRIRVKVLER